MALTGLLHGMFATDITTLLQLSLVLILVIITFFFLSHHLRAPKLPAINAYPNDFLNRKAYEAHRISAIALVQEGFKKFKGPFRIITPTRNKVILPSEYTEWVRTSKDVSHQAYVADEFYAEVPGFEGQKVISDEGGAMITITKARLSNNAESIPVMSQLLVETLERVWTDRPEWHTLDWLSATQSLISSMSAGIFVGPRLARNPAWHKTTMAYTNNFAKGAFSMMAYPRWTAMFAHWVHPSVKACGRHLKELRALLDAEIKQRELDRREGTDEGRPRDCIDWVAEDTHGMKVDQAEYQAAFAIAALHTTSETLRQTLLDILMHPELVEPLKMEIERVVEEHGLTLAAVYKMQLLDSVMKESQRFASASVGLERKVTRTVTLPNGTILPRGTNLGVDASDMWNPAIHKYPNIFDGYRFLRMREEGGPIAGMAFVSSTKEHNTFGTGKFICPGRFLAANEIKLCVVHILMKYDVRLKEGSRPRGERMGFFFKTDCGVEVEVRRREEGKFDVDVK